MYDFFRAGRCRVDLRPDLAPPQFGSRRQRKDLAELRLRRVDGEALSVLSALRARRQVERGQFCHLAGSP